MREEYKVSEVKDRGAKIIYNGQEYGVGYDYYMGDYRFTKGNELLNGAYGRYYGLNSRGGEEYRSEAFKEGFISERVFECCKKYDFKPLYKRNGNQYVNCNGWFAGGYRNCETAFYDKGRYWYVKIGSDGYPEVEKAFLTQAALMEYVEEIKTGKKPARSTIDKAVDSAIITGAAGLLAYGLYKKLTDKDKQ